MMFPPLYKLVIIVLLFDVNESPLSAWYDKNVCNLYIVKMKHTSCNLAGSMFTASNVKGKLLSR